jgi:hypothetical protein
MQPLPCCLDLPYHQPQFHGSHNELSGFTFRFLRLSLLSSATLLALQQLASDLSASAHGIGAAMSAAHQIFGRPSVRHQLEQPGEAPPNGVIGNAVPELA